MSRQKRARDHKTVYHLIRSAPKKAEHIARHEQDLVVTLHNSKAFIPKLSPIVLRHPQYYPKGSEKNTLGKNIICDNCAKDAFYPGPISIGTLVAFDLGIFFTKNR